LHRCTKKGEASFGSPAVASGSSDDSFSTDEGIAGNISCSNLATMVKVVDDKYKLYEFDSKVGLNGSQTHCNFPCLLEEEKKTFFVWLGDVTIDKFTKSTFLNLANFAETNGAKQVVLIQVRDHVQKDQFRKLFKVLDAKRVSKKGMTEMLANEKLDEKIEQFALYKLDI